MYVFDNQAVQALRKRQGLSREQLAIEIGVGYETIVVWELRKGTPSAKNFSKLVQVLGCEPADLYTLEVPKPSRRKVDAG